MGKQSQWETFVRNPDLLRESLSELIMCDEQEAVDLWAEDWLLLRKLEAQIAESKTFAWESTNRERLIQGGWTPPEPLEKKT